MSNEENNKELFEVFSPLIYKKQLSKEKEKEKEEKNDIRKKLMREINKEFKRAIAFWNDDEGGLGFHMEHPRYIIHRENYQKYCDDKNVDFCERIYKEFLRSDECQDLYYKYREEEIVDIKEIEHELISPVFLTQKI